MPGRKDSVSRNRADLTTSVWDVRKESRSPHLGATEKPMADAGNAVRFIVGMVGLDALGLDVRTGVPPAPFQERRCAHNQLRGGNEPCCRSHQRLHSSDGDPGEDHEPKDIDTTPARGHLLKKTNERPVASGGGSQS